jgi:hypothetical protein
MHFPASRSTAKTVVQAIIQANVQATLKPYFSLQFFSFALANKGKT